MEATSSKRFQRDFCELAIFSALQRKQAGLIKKLEAGEEVIMPELR